MVANEQLMELLQQQLTGGASLPDSIAGLAQSDPQLSQLANLLAQREQQLKQDLERQEQEELQHQDDVRRLHMRRERAEALRRHLEELTAELEAVRSTLDEVAAALGACPSCFGADPACRWCRGRGRPGFMPPDPASFQRLVLPAVRVHVRMRGRPTTEPDNQPTREGGVS